MHQLLAMNYSKTSEQQSLAAYCNGLTNTDRVNTNRYRNEAWLREQYIDERRMPADIAEECGVIPCTIRDWVRKHGIEPRTRSEAKLTEAALDKRDDASWLREQYIENRRSTCDIAGELNVASSTVSNWLEKHGIDTRSLIEELLPEKAIDKRDDASWLREQYVDCERSLCDIADELGVSTVTVYKWLNKHGIKIRKTVIDVEHLDHVVRSDWELRVAELLTGAGVDYQYEGMSVDYIDENGKHRTYTPDFVSGDYIIEVKGRRRNTERLAAKAEAVMQSSEKSYVVVGNELPCDVHIQWGREERLLELFG